MLSPSTGEETHVEVALSDGYCALSAILGPHSHLVPQLIDGRISVNMLVRLESYGHVLDNWGVARSVAPACMHEQQYCNTGRSSLIIQRHFLKIHSITCTPNSSSLALLRSAGLSCWTGLLSASVRQSAIRIQRSVFGGTCPR